MTWKCHLKLHWSRFANFVTRFRPARAQCFVRSSRNIASPPITNGFISSYTSMMGTRPESFERQAKTKQRQAKCPRGPIFLSLLLKKSPFQANARLPMAMTHIAWRATQSGIVLILDNNIVAARAGDSHFCSSLGSNT